MSERRGPLSPGSAVPGVWHEVLEMREHHGLRPDLGYGQLLPAYHPQKQDQFDKLFKEFLDPSCDPEAKEMIDRVLDSSS